MRVEGMLKRVKIGPKKWAPEYRTYFKFQATTLE